MNTLPQFSAPNTGAIRFADIDNESVAVAHDAALSAASWTVEAWVTTTNADADFNRVVTKPVGGNQTYSIIVVNGEAQIRSNVGTVTHTGVTVADGVPHHIAGVFDSVAETLSLYVDGALISTISTTGQTLLQGTEDLIVGDFPGGFVEAFDGDISDVRIWSDVRTTEEIAATFDQSLDGGAPNLELHLRFDGDATDSSGNGRDGVVNGAPVFVEGLAPVDPLPFDPMTLAATEDVAEAITGLQVSDADPGAVLTVSVEAASGALTLATTTGLTFTAGGNGRATFTAQGTVADLNAALATLTYLGDPDFNGADNIVLTVDDGQADVVEPVSGALVIPNSGIFFIYDFDTGTGFTEAQAGATPAGAPTNGVYVTINPNNAEWGATASLVENGVTSFLSPTNFNLVGYAGGSFVSGDAIQFEDAITGLTLIYSNEDTPTPTGARDITFTFNGLDFTDTPPGNMNLDDATFSASSEAVVEIPVTVASVVDAAPVITQAQATGDVTEINETAPIEFAAFETFDTLDGVNGFNINGQSADENLGNDIAGLGDVNGDGFDDFIVGANLTNNGAGAFAGAAHVIFGTDAGLPADFDVANLDGTNGFSVEGVAANDFVGSAVDGVGDINSDGFDDIIVGSRGSSEAFVLYGKASGFAATLTSADLDGTVGTNFSGVANSFFGYAASAAGDVNGDGVDDLIIGAQTNTTAGGPQAGSAYVVFGQVGGFGANFDITTLDGSNGFKLDGLATDDRLGSSVEGGGDINGDGFDDLLIGAYRQSSGAYMYNGATYVVFGGPTGFDGEIDLTSLNGANGFVIEGNRDSQNVGKNIGFIGDINNDGVDDFAIGDDNASPNGNTVAGQVHVVFGDATGAFPANLDIFNLNGTNGFTINGPTAIDRIGSSIDAAGDLNLDGIDDFLIGGDGEAYVVYGNGAGFGPVVELSTLNGADAVQIIDNSGDRVGLKVAGIGDFNGDGVNDITASSRIADVNGVSNSGRAATIFVPSDDRAVSGEIQFQNGASRASHTVSAVSTSGPGLGEFTAEIIDAHDPGGLGVVEWNFTISTADLDPLAEGEVLTQTYDVIISNGDTSTTQSITVNINGANDAPFALDDDFTTDEDSVVSGDLFFDNGFGFDFDTDFADIFSVIEIDGQTVNNGDVVTLASGANLTIRSDGTFDYDPNGQFETLGVGATGNDSFTYRITDGAAPSGEQIGGALSIPQHATFILDFDTGQSSFELNFGATVPPFNGVVIVLNPNPSNFEVLAEIYENGGVTFASDSFSLLGYGGASGPTVGGQRFAFEDDITNLDLIWSRSGVPSPTGPRDVAFTFDDVNFVDDAAGSATIASSTVENGVLGDPTAVVNLTINGANDGPIAQDDSFFGDEDALIFGDLFADNGNGLDEDIDGVFTVSQIDGAVVTNGQFVTLASGAGLTIRADGTFDYDPIGVFDGLADAEVGVDTFTYSIVDDQGAMATATAIISLAGLNDAPVAIDDDLITDEDTVLFGDLIGDNGFGADFDVDNGAVLGVTEINGVPVFDGESVLLPSGAILLIRADGTFDYDPNGAFEALPQGATALDSFTYTVADEFGAPATATANITIVGVNDAPIAFDESFDLDEDTPIFGDLFSDANSDGFFSFDPDGDPLSITQINGAPVTNGQLVTLASGGALVIRTDGTFDFDPAGAYDNLSMGASQVESFTFLIEDPIGGAASATANLVISGVNDAPLAFDDDLTTDEDSVLSGSLLDDNGLGADFDVDNGAILGVTEINGTAVFDGEPVVLPSGAILLIRADGTFDYDPNGAFEALPQGATAPDSFTYTIADEFGATATATANVTIFGVNDAPVAFDESFDLDEDTPIFGDLFSDANSDGLVSFDPEGDPLSVTQINGAPITNGQAIALAGGGTLVISTDGTFDFDPSGAYDNLSVGASQVESFTFQIEDIFGGTATATANLNIAGVNDTPLAFDESFDLDAVTSISGNLFFDANSDGFNSFDPDGDLLVVGQINGAPVFDGQAIILPSGAELVIRTDGSFDYDPQGQFDGVAPGAIATDSFTYQIDDGFGGVANATAVLNIEGVNADPVAQNDSFITDEDNIVFGNLLDDNGAGPDVDVNAGAILNVTEINGAPVFDGEVSILPSGAALTTFADGTFSYDPTEAFNGLTDGDVAPDSFTYTITDEFGAAAAATVNLTVNGVNDAPVAFDESFNLDEETPISGDLFFDANSDGFMSFDPEGDALSIAQINGAPVSDGQIFNLPDGGLLTIRLDGTFDFDPRGDFDDAASTEQINTNFTYQISDAFGGVSTAIATLSISGVNDAPEAIDDEFTTVEGDVLNGNLFDDNGLGADTDVDIDKNGPTVFSVAEINGAAVSDGQAIALASGAVLTIQSNGAFTYDQQGVFIATPEGGAASDSFTYTIADEDGALSTATANITINGLNQAPVAADDAFTLNEGAPFDGDLFADNGAGPDADIDLGDSFTISQIDGAPVSDGQAVTLASGAALIIRNDGTFTYEEQGAFGNLADGDVANDAFTYTIGDGFGGAATASANLTIVGVTAAPIAATDEIEAGEDAPVSGDLFADNGAGPDIDPETGAALIVTQINGAPVADGQAVPLPSGALLTIRADGTFDYDPAGAFEALGEGDRAFDDFTYTIASEAGETAEATAIITVNGANDAPVALFDTFATDANSPISGDLLADNGLGADSDVDAGAILTVTEINGAAVAGGDIVTLPSGAVLTIRTDGTFDYDPAGATGADAFAYTINDGFGGTSSATAEIAIESVNAAPEAQDDSFALQKGGVITGNLFADNGEGADADADGDDLGIVQIADLFPSQSGAPLTATLASGAVVTFASTGDFTYDASAAFGDLGAGEVASEQFTYLVSDQQGGLDEALVTFTVTGVNAAPLARDDAFTTDEDTAIGGLFLLADNGAGADADADGDDITLISIEGVAATAGDTILLASGAEITVGEAGEVAYDPNAAFEALTGGETATDSFIYQISDGQGGTSEATVEVEIAGLSDIIFGSNETDFLEGTAGDDDIRALDGGDFVSGFGGDDVIDGGAGNDRARGGRGDDSVSGGEGNDALFGEGGNDILAGGDGNDRLRGQRGDDRLLGEDGDDVLAGARGADTLLGGDGADTLAGGADNDLLRGQAGDDKLGGSRGDDMLLGGGGADRIRGGGGDDTLHGGKDNDTLIGGAGEDVFRFAANDGADVIRRFQQDADLIEVMTDGIGFGDLTITQQGANVAIGIGATDVLVTAQNAADFDADDFIFFG